VTAAGVPSWLQTPLDAGGTLRTSIGDWGAAITARTFRGQITLVKQPPVDAKPAAPGGTGAGDPG